jgi:colicin import membrane protein
MFTTFLPVLAFNEMELIVGAIGVIILFGNWVTKRLKEAGTKQQLRQQVGSEPDPTLEQMAARRREQLRSMSSTRQAATPPTAPGTVLGAGPGSTPKTLYERRAEALRRARQSQSGQQPSVAAAAAQDLEVQRHREAEAQARLREQQEVERRARIEAEAKRRLQQQQQQQRQQQQRQREAAERRRRMDHIAELEKHRPASHRHTSTASERARTHALANSPTQSETRRRVENADSSAYDQRASTRPTWIGPALIGRESLRRAIVLAEVLGKPVALRSPTDQI